jgi:O-antigen ligase
VVVAVALAVWFVIEVGLTFSRGGMVSLVVAALVAAPHFLARRRTAVRFVGFGLLGFVLATVVVIPTVQRITGNQFGDRFSSFETTMRTDISGEDLRLFGEHPIDGVGVGGADAQRDIGGGTDAPVVAHTEYTRLLAEHGIFGLLAVGALIAIGVTAYRDQRGPVARAWTIALLAFAGVTMAHSATRLMVVPFAVGLAALVLDLTTPTEPARLSGISPLRAPPDDRG